MTIKEIFDSMAYGPAPESSAEALAWIAKHQGRFGHWIDGAFAAAGETFATRNPATGDVLALVTQEGPACHTNRRSCFYTAVREGAEVEILSPMA